jgi:hypothetical protein
VLGVKELSVVCIRSIVRFRRFAQHFYFGQFSLARHPAFARVLARGFGYTLRIIYSAVSVASSTSTSARSLGFSGASGCPSFG